MKRILIVRLTALGDIIHSSVVLEFIKRESASIEIDWLVEKSFSAILDKNPYIRKIYPINLKSLKKDRSWKNIVNIYSQLKDISKNNYDLIIDLQGLMKSAIVSRIIGNNIHGFSFQSAKESFASIFYRTKTISDYSENKIWRNMKMVNDSLNLNIFQEDILRKKPHLFFKDKSFSSNGNTIFVVGSSMPQKNYPKEKFLDLAKNIDGEISIIWGSKVELEIAEWLSANCNKISLAPKMNLDQLIYFISTSSIVIGNDTGPTHIAWAVNIPSIILFGLTPVEQAFKTKINRRIKSKSFVNHKKIDKKDFSIKDIETQEILYEISIIKRR